MADKSMDPKIIEEVTRVIFETTPKEWSDWHPQGKHMTTEIKAASPLPDVAPALAITELACYSNISSGNPHFFSFRN